MTIKPPKGLCVAPAWVCANISHAANPPETELRPRNSLQPAQASAADPEQVPLTRLQSKAAPSWQGTLTATRGSPAGGGAGLGTALIDSRCGPLRRE